MENGHEPATKADITLLRSELTLLGGQLRSEVTQLGEQLRSEVTQLGEQLRSESQHQYDDLKETMRDGQTELLKAFYSFAKSTELKLKETEIDDMMLRERLSAVEMRLLEVERRLNLPGQPQQ